MNIYQVTWIKIVNHQGKDKYWAYELDYFDNPEAKSFHLHWRSRKDKANAQQPRKGDLMLLLQKTKPTHIVEFLDDDVSGGERDEWSIYRKVKAVWMPPERCLWKKDLPHQRELFGFSPIVGDGRAHTLADKNKMPQFHQHWELQAFQKHLHDMLENI